MSKLRQKAPASEASPAETELIGLPEVAELLGVHYMTAYRYVRTGRLRAELVGGLWKVDPGELHSLAQPPARPRRRVGGSRERTAAMLEAALLNGDAPAAFTVVDDALARWATPEDVLTEMLVVAMHHIGDRWESGEITVADEHQAAVVAARIVGRLGPRFAHRGRHRGTVVVGVAAGDQHGLPSAIVADLLRQAGFRVIDLGADTPVEAFVEVATKADRLLAVGIGSTVTKGHRSVAATVRALHEACPGVPVIVGGASVSSRELAQRLGADLWSGGDARSVVHLVLAKSPEGADPPREP